MGWKRNFWGAVRAAVAGPRRPAPPAHGQRGGVCFETLEARVLFSADAMAIDAARAVDPDASAATSWVPYVESVVTSRAAEPVVLIPRPASSPPAEGPSAQGQGVNADAGERTAPARRELVVVDAAVADPRTLLADLGLDGAQGRLVDLLFLDAGADGVAQITAHLRDAEAPYDAVHVFGHGSAGRLLLGNAELTETTAATYAEFFAQWRGALTEAADILVYGCDVAASEAGRTLLGLIAAWTGADVAASDDLTGHATLGGDWVMEFGTGAIESAIVVGARAQEAWLGRLAANATTTGTQSHVSLATHDDGTFVAVWQSDGQDGGGLGIYGRRFDANGNPLGGEFLVNQTTADDQTTPDVAMDSAGNFVVVWTSEGQAGDATTEGNILARRYDASGNALGGEFVVNTTVAGDQETPVVAFETQSDSFMVAWASELQDGSGWGVYARKFDAAGTALTAEFRVNTTIAGDQLAPDVAGDTFGDFQFVWQSQGQDGGGWGIYRQYYANNDNFQGPETRVNDTTAGDQTDAAVAFDSNGNYLVVWVSAGQDGAGTGIYGNFVRYAGNGGNATGEFRVNSTTALDQLAPAVARDGDRNFVVAWHSFGQDADGAAAVNVYGQLLEHSGPRAVPFGTEFRLNTFQTGDQQRVALAMGDGGNYVAAWDGNGADDADGIAFRQFPDPFDATAPIVTLANPGLVYVENAGLLPIDPVLEVADADSNTLVGATINFLSGFVAGEDEIVFTAQLGIGGSYDAATGVLTLTGNASVASYQTALRTVAYRNTSDAPTVGARQIQVAVSDGLHFGADDRSVSVQAANDAPVLSGANALVGITEDPASNAGTLVSALVSAQVSDADTGAVVGIAVTGVDATHGTWEYTTNGGGAWNAFGTPTAAGARLLAADASTAVRFVPNANWHGTVASGITFRAWDRTSGVAGGTADTTVNGATTAYSTATAAAGITVSSVNDAPAGTDRTVTINEDTSHVFTAVDFGFVDAADSPANVLAAVIITTLPGAGSLTNDGVAISAGQRIVRADIDAGRLRFTPAQNASGAGYAAFTFQVEDDGGTAGGGSALDPTANTLTIDVTSVNDPPAIDMPAAQRTAFNTVLTFSAAAGNALSIGDVDAAPGSVQVDLTVTNGVLSLGGVAGLVFTTGDGVLDGAMRFTGTIADVNAALDGLVYTPTPAFSGLATLGLVVDDQGNSGTGGALFTTDEVPITVDPASTLVIVDDTAATDAETAIGTGSVLANDSDPALGTLSVTAVNGSAGAVGTTIILPSGARLLMQADGTYTYTPNDAFDALAGAATAADAFVYEVTSTSAASGSGTVVLTITGLNDAPVLSGANALVGITEDPASNAGTLVSALVSGRVSDADAGAVVGIAVTGVDATNGTWEYTTNGGGAWNAFGTPTTASARLLAADASTAVRFVPNANWHGTVASGITFRAWDRTSGVAGGTADTTVNGTTTAYSTATASAGITVSSVNDAPAGTDNTVTTNEDTAHVFTAADFGFVDAVDSPANALAAVTITTLPGAGSLTNDGVAISAGQRIVRADIDAGRLRFTPAQNASGAGYATFTFQVEDDGGSAGGGSALDPTANTLTIDVTSINDPPAGANVGIAIDEDGVHVFGVADFALADVADSPANALAAVQIVTLPGAGTLTNDSIAVLSGQFVSVADIAAGRLRYAPAADANGAAYASIGFKVQDDGGTTNGGVDLATATRFVTFTVNAVNDAPALTGFGAAVAATDEDTYATIGLADLVAQGDESDVDGAVQGFRVASVATGSLLIGTSFGTASAWSAGSNDVVDATRTAYWIGAANAFGSLGAFSVRAIDDRGAMSAAAVTATVTVRPVADTPSITGAATQEDTQSTAGLVLGRNAADGAEVTHFRIVSVDGGALFLNDGITPIAAGDFISFAQGAAGLRFTPALDAVAAGSVQIMAATSAGNAGLGGARATGTITVTPVNDAPTLTGANALADLTAGETQNAGSAVSDLIAGHVLDVDGDPAGIAIVAADDAHGDWQYSLDAGLTWANVGAVSDSAALLLAADPGVRVRFVPDAGYVGTAQVTLRAWDRTSGTSGAVADASGHGGAGAFSAQQAAVTVAVRAVVVDPVPVDGQARIAGMGSAEPVAALSETPPPLPRSTDALEGAPRPPTPAPQGSGRAPSPAPSIEAGAVEPAAVPVDGSTRGGEAVVAPPTGAAPATQTADAPRGGETQPQPGPTGPAIPGRPSLGAAAVAILGADFVPQPEATASAVVQTALSEAFDQVREETRAEAKLEQQIAGAAVAMSGSLSAGYVLWLVRGGVLMSSVLSSLPAWRVIDPLPVLARQGRLPAHGDEDDDSLESLVETPDDAARSPFNEPRPAYAAAGVDRTSPK